MAFGFVKKGFKKYKAYEAKAPQRREAKIVKLKQETELAKLKAEKRKFETQHRSSGGGFGVGQALSNFSRGSSDFFGSSIYSPTKPKKTKRKRRRY